jgi:hypothetical protein
MKREPAVVHEDGASRNLIRFKVPMASAYDALRADAKIENANHHSQRAPPLCRGVKGIKGPSFRQVSNKTACLSFHSFTWVSSPPQHLLRVVANVPRPSCSL